MRQYDSTTTAAADKSFGKKEKTIKLLLRGGPHGGCFQDFEICHNNFAEGGGRKNMTWAVFDFLPFRSTAVCCTTFRRDLLLQLLNPYHIISAVTSLQAATKLEVACLLLCVLRDEHLQYVAPSRFACCWHRLLYRC